MKKWRLWQKLLVVASVLVGALFIVMFGGGALLDGKIDLSLEKRLSAPPDILFKYLDNQPGLSTWWGAMAAPQGMKMTVKKKPGPDEGQGLAVQFLDAKDKVMETWLVKSAEPPTKITYAVDFGGVLTVERTLTLVPDGEGTRVTWAETGTITRPAMRWMKVLMPQQEILDNFDKALGALDRASRSR